MNYLKGQHAANKSSKKHLLDLNCIIILLFLFMLLPLPSRAEYSDRYVSTSGRDTFTNGKPNNCLSINNPCRTIQHAINLGEWEDVVKVQSGVYTENIVVNEYKGNLTIQGGWNRNFSSRHINPWSVTTISGSNSASVFYIWAQSFSVVLTIDGFTLTDGDGTQGGAIFVLAQSAEGGTISGAYVVITLNNNRIIGNKALGEGGGIHAACGRPEPGFYPNAIDLILTNNIISDNWAMHGGAIEAVVFGSSALWVELSDNVLRDNHADWNGGAIYFKAYNNPGDKAKFFLKRNIIQNNESGKEGGGLALYAVLDSTAVLSLENNLIAGNVSKTVCGGGIFVQNEEGDIDLSLLNDTITDNTCNQNPHAAGIRMSTQGLWGSIKANLVNEIVWGNHGAFDISTSGGSVVDISYSDIGILAVGGTYNEGEGVIKNVDPLFVDASNGDYHIRSVSPVRDQGICGKIDLRFDTERIAPLGDFENDPRPNPGTLDCDRWFPDPSGNIRCVVGRYLGCDMGADEIITDLVTLPGIPLLLLGE